MTRPVSPRVDLPATALLDKDGKTSVWIVEPNNTVALREVTVAARSGDRITATSGVRSGERVVIAGVHSLAPGQAVKVGP